MKPKTVGRATAGSIPHARKEFCHDGLIAGTIVLTGDGEIPVQYLSPGDRIITRNAGMVRLVQARLTRAVMHAVRIEAGLLGQKRPETPETARDACDPSCQPAGAGARLARARDDWAKPGGAASRMPDRW